MRLLPALAVSLALLFSASSEARGSVRVKSYARKDGTYVPAHRRTSANSTKADNWSTKGNVNPYTGKKGSKP